ncbi:hypothetical protein [Halobacillus salinus]|uniref:Uncharacterized protein n=1 Tax=Halobacillus salinus TaxID=192814 RepID=A0A4Z0GXZ7_9BACI|nr:hypothetical protein [Halobacillus salinus]TGB02010.1 hypothetical protein E4663_15375 [Halobacillus salinus]
MSSQQWFSTIGVGLAFFALFAVPFSLAGVAIAAIVILDFLIVPVLIALLVLTLIFFGVFAYLLSKFIDAVYHPHHHHHYHHNEQ